MENLHVPALDMNSHGMGIGVVALSRYCCATFTVKQTTSLLHSRTAGQDPLFVNDRKRDRSSAFQLRSLHPYCTPLARQPRLWVQGSNCLSLSPLLVRFMFSCPPLNLSPP
jgi:hypothetical protein